MAKGEDSVLVTRSDELHENTGQTGGKLWHVKGGRGKGAASRHILIIVISPRPSYARGRYEAYGSTGRRQ